MKQKLIVTFCFLILINEIASQIKLKATDICIKVKECSRKNSIQCGTDHCAVDLAKCQQFTSLTSFVGFLKHDNYRQMFTANYETLVNKIKPCDHFNPNDACVRKKVCFERKRVPLRTGFAHYEKRVKCKCDKKRQTVCGNFCSVNRKTCNNLKSSPSLALSLSYC